MGDNKTQRPTFRHAWKQSVRLQRQASPKPHHTISTPDVSTLRFSQKRTNHPTLPTRTPPSASFSSLLTQRWSTQRIPLTKQNLMQSHPTTTTLLQSPNIASQPHTLFFSHTEPYRNGISQGYATGDKMRQYRSNYAPVTSNIQRRTKRKRQKPPTTISKRGVRPSTNP